MEMHRFIHESLRILVTIGGCIWLGQAASAQQTGTCRRFLGEAYLDANNVSARIMNTGGLFYRGEPREYRVPRFSDSNANFAAAIWIGGMIDGQFLSSGVYFLKLTAGKLEQTRKMVLVR